MSDEQGQSEQTGAGKATGQEALRISEEQKDAILNGITTNIAFVDKDLKLLWANAAAAKSVNKSPAEMIGQTCHAFWADPAKPCENCPTVRAFQTKQTEHTLMYTPDGRVRDEKGEPVFDERGDVIGVVETAQDITERKRAEDALKESEERFKAIANYTVNWESWFGTDGKYLWVNPAVEHLTGYSAEEILAMPDFISTVIAEEDRDLFIARFQEAIRGDRGENFEFRYLHKNGSKLWLSASWQPIFDAKGNSLGVRSSGRDITERKKAEEELHNERLLLHALIDNVPDSIYSKDLACRKTLVNLTDLLYMGAKSEAEVLGKDDFEFYPKELAERFFADDQSVMQTGKPVLNREEYILDEKEQKRWLLSSKLPLRDKDSQIIGLVGIGRDITERKRAEEEIGLHEGHLQDLLSLHRMAKASEKEILDFTLEASLRTVQSKFTFVGLMNADETVLTIHAWSKETMEQCAITEKPIQFPLAETSLLGEAVRQRRPIIVNDYPSSDVPKKGIPSGHVPITRFMSVPVFSAGKIVAVAAVANKETDYSDSDVGAFTSLLNEMWNLLEQKLKDEALRESEEEFRGLFENALTGVAVHQILLDERGKAVDYIYLQANAAFETQTGLHVADVLGKRATEVFANAKEAPFIDIYGKVALTGEPVTFEQFFEPLRRHYHINVYQVGQGRFATVFQDITDRKQLEERIRQVRSDLLFAVSHDLKSPLQTLRQTQEMLGKLPPAEALARFQEYGEIWRRNLQRLERMINNLVDSQRGEEDRFPLLLAPCDSAEMVRRVAEDLQGHAQANQVTLDLKLEPVPEGSCDQEALARVVENLLTNAIKFSPKGEKVEVRLGMEGDTLRLEVEDHGAGIPALEQGQLFQPFQRGRSAQQKRIPGTGLGLYVCRRIVEEHGGSISLQSKEGKGTTMTVRLPWGKVAEAEGSPQRAPSFPPDNAPGSHENTER